MRCWTIAFALSAVLLTLGCSGGSNQEKTAPVKGSVTIDGMALANGKIVFDGGTSVPAVELEIKDGKYEGESTLGKKTVRIYSYRRVAPPPGMTGPEYEQGVLENTLPARYNAASQVAREVKEDETNTFDFQVTSN